MAEAYTQYAELPAKRLASWCRITLTVSSVGVLIISETLLVHQQGYGSCIFAMRPSSSNGQSTWFLPRMLRVRILPGTPHLLSTIAKYYAVSVSHRPLSVPRTTHTMMGMHK